MAYFRELPDISYVSLLPNSNKSDDRITIKNLFKRAKLRTDIDQAITAFDYLEIPENTRPDILAEQIYNDPELDWVILITNNITNIRDQWPLSHNDLYSYCLEKYGSDTAIMSTHHWETQEIKDKYGRVILEGKLIVDEDFQFTYVKDDYTAVVTSPAQSVSNLSYEQKVNESKRRIKILKPAYLSAFITDMRNMMRYSTSSQYIDRTLKVSYNPKENGV